MHGPQLLETGNLLHSNSPNSYLFVASDHGKSHCYSSEKMKHSKKYHSLHTPSRSVADMREVGAGRKKAVLYIEILKSKIFSSVMGSTNYSPQLKSSLILLRKAFTLCILKTLMYLLSDLQRKFADPLYCLQIPRALKYFTGFLHNHRWGERGCGGFCGRC